jgi:hypothetical protein
MPYNLKRSNCTSRAEANAAITNTTHTNNVFNKTLHHLNMGEKPKVSCREPRHCHQRVPR